MTSKPNVYSGLQITVFGANRSGIAVARLLHDCGAKIILTDSRELDLLKSEVSQLDGLPIDFQLGGHTEACIENSDLIVVSPGVPLDIPILREARSREKSIIGELEVSSSLCKAPIVAITGTKGKSTTTLLTAAILEKCNLFRNVVVAGNIGVPLSSEVASLTDKDIAVVEVSSFQLESTCYFHPEVSAVLNLSRDHLDRHKTMDAYINAKRKIYRNQTTMDWIVLNEADERLKPFSDDSVANVAYFTDNLNDTDKGLNSLCVNSGCMVCVGLRLLGDEINIYSYHNQQENLVCNVSDLPLAGSHNIRNVLAATTIGTIYGVSHTDIREVLLEFDTKHDALAHAFEKVRVLNGVEYINDSKATNVIATYAALESIKNTRQISEIGKSIFLIIGGFDKGNIYEPLIELVKETVKCLILLGEHTHNIHETLREYAPIYRAGTMEDAVEYADSHAEKGDIVLLSPANASFDMYSDYKERGETFKNTVNSLNT